MRSVHAAARFCHGKLPWAVLLVGCAWINVLPAQERSVATEEASQSEIDDDLPEHFKAFSELLTGATLVGHFTLPGMKTDKPLHEERYEIRSVTKTERGDYWLFLARIKYGDHDVTIPLPLEVKWAGTTPVITLDGVTIPKLGTFDARVVIDGKQYAGTWKHDDVGGHLFGRIEKQESAAATEDESSALTPDK